LLYCPDKANCLTVVNPIWLGKPYPIQTWLGQLADSQSNLLQAYTVWNHSTTSTNIEATHGRPI